MENDDRKYEIYGDSERIFKAAFMNLRGFSSNDPEVVSRIRKSDQGNAIEQSLLGLIWNTKDETLGIYLKAFKGKTKREMVQFIACHFNPLSILTPIFLPWKVLCQELYINNVQWDDEIPLNLKNKLEVLKKN